MSEVQVSDDLRNLIADIILENDWEVVGEVKYYPGTEAGDGYASKHVTITIPLKTGLFRLFAKYSLPVPPSENLPLDKFYGNEGYFYEKLYPVFLKFAQEKNVKGAFNNVPKCYRTSPKFIIVLENLRDKRFDVYERTIPMDECHINWVFKTLAKFHAISFVMKDQDKQSYNQLLNEWDGDFLRTQRKDSLSSRMFKNMISEGLQKFDREEDRSIRERCRVEELFDIIIEAAKPDYEHSVFTQGDCWCNNIMFLYENVTNTKPMAVKLIDWQMLRPTSTVYDLSYFFFSVATLEDLKRYDYFLDVYYKELSDQIKQFGSDPELLYPKSLLREEWKRYCKFGFAYAFILLKFVLAKREEAPNMESYDFESDDSKDIQLFTKFSNEDVYDRRMRILAEFMVDNDLI